MTLRTLLPALLLLLAVPVIARAQVTVLDTFGPSNSVSGSATLNTGTTYNAVRFTTPAAVSTIVQRVELTIGVSGSVPGASVAIFADAGGLPGITPIITQAITSPIFTTNSFTTVSFTSTAPLNPATNYWVGVLTPTTGGNGIGWSNGLSAAPTAQFSGGSWIGAQPQTPAVRVVLINAPTPPCTPTPGVDTFGPNNAFTGTGTQGINAAATAAWRFTVPAGVDRPILSVEMPIGVIGRVDDATVAIWAANAANTLPSGAPLILQSITSPLGATPAVVSVPFSSPTRLAPGNYFVGLRSSAAGANFLLWSSSPSGAGGVPFSSNGGGSWSLVSNPLPPAVRMNLGCPAGQCEYGTIFDLFGPNNSTDTSGPNLNATSTVSAVRFTIPDGVPRLAWLVDARVQANVAASNITLNIWPDVAGLPSTNPIIASTIPSPPVGTPTILQWIINSPIPLTPGASYWIGITSDANPTLGASVTFFRGGLPVFLSSATRRFDGAWTLSAANNATLAVRIFAECADFGACCARSGGGCVLLSRAECALSGGAFNTGFPCQGFACAATLPGACCTGAACTQTTSAACAGTFLGVGIACLPPRAGGPNVCCGADFDNSGARDVSDIFRFLSGWFAGCP